MLFLPLILVAGAPRVTFDTYINQSHSLLYAVIIHSIPSDVKKQIFRENPENATSYIGSKLTLNAPIPILANQTLSRSDALDRRLSLSSFPSCDLYACPPGPCTVYDIDYQFKYSYDDSDKSYNFESIGRCGPAFNVQLVDKTEFPYKYFPENTDNLRVYFPENNDDPTNPVYVYKPLSASLTGFSGLVPVLGVLTNHNPRYYYTSDYAYTSGSLEHLNKFNCTDSAPVLKHTPSLSLFGAHPYAGCSTVTSRKGGKKTTRETCTGEADGERILGSFLSDTAANFLLRNETYGVIPQTYHLMGDNSENSTEQADYYNNTCDLSQCMLVPVVDPTDYKSLNSVFNCFYQSMLADFKKDLNVHADFVSNYTAERCWPSTPERWANPGNPTSLPKSDDGTYGVLKNTNAYNNNNIMVGQYETMYWNTWFFNSEFEDPGKGAETLAPQPTEFKCISRDDPNQDKIHGQHFRTPKQPSTLPGFMGTCFGFPSNPSSPEGTLECIKGQIQKIADYDNDHGSSKQEFEKYDKVTNLAGIDAGIFWMMDLLSRTGKHAKGEPYSNRLKNLEYYDKSSNSIQFWMWVNFIYNEIMLPQIPMQQKNTVTYTATAAYKTPIQDYLSSTYAPLQGAISGYPPAPVATLALNASILNSYTKSESAACNCGNQGIQYAFLDLPWSAIIEGAGKGDADMLAFFGNFSAGHISSSDLNYSSTALRQSSYSWNDPATGDFRDGMPIGLYIPSSRRFDRNFTTIERDFLRNKTRIEDTAEFELSKELAEKYYAGDKAPERETLTEDLLFTGAPSDSLPYKTRTMTYQYGACMKPPYGQYSSFEYSHDDFHTLFPNCIYDDDECYVTEESLIGYCEEIPDMSGSKRLGYCFDDPLSYANRQKLCQNPRAKNIVLAQTLGVRSPPNICSKTSKTCLVIPGEPGAGINAILTSPDVYGDLSGYTLLVTPFNYSIATAITAAGRHMYPAGNLNGMTRVDDNNTTLLGTAAVNTEDFRALYDQTKGVDNTIASIDTIVGILQPDPSVTSFEFPYITEVPEVTLDFLFPAHPIAGIVVNYPGVTIRPASTKMNLRIVPVLGNTDASPVPCTFAYIGAADFLLTNTEIDYATCPIKSGMDASAVVFGGSDVGSSRVYVDVFNSTEPAVLFAGGDIAHFPRATSVNAANVTLSLATYSNSSMFAVAAAKTYGDITLDLNNTNLNGSAHVLVQPGTSTTSNANQSLSWDATADNITLTIIDVSIYTRVFGDNILELDYPQTHAQSHFHLAVFVISILIIVFVVAVFAKRWIEFYLTYLREGNYDTGVEVRTTVFGQIIDLPNKSVPVGTYMEKHSAEYHRPATGMLDAAVAGNLNQSLRRRGTSFA
jgi:hypothetical protein